MMSERDKTVELHVDFQRGEQKIPFKKKYKCYNCMDTGEVQDMQYDSDSHNYYDDGSTKPCICTL